MTLNSALLRGSLQERNGEAHETDPYCRPPGGSDSGMTVFTRKCQYALSALYVLGREYGNGPVSTSRLAAHASTSVAFLETILLQLRNAGLLESHRGVRGGYSLLMPPDKLTIGFIARLIDGPVLSVACGDEQGACKCDDCRQGRMCELQRVMQQAQEAVAAILDNTVLISQNAPVSSPALVSAAGGG
jgi:Rrf2 family protein